MSPGWSLLAVPLLIALNAFFVASEYALVAARPAQVRQLRRRGQRRSARAIEQMRLNPASAIGAIQVCITMTNLLLGWIGEPAMSALLLLLFGPLVALWPVLLSSVSIVLSFIIVTLLTVVFSELLPKAMTLRHVPAAIALTAVPVRAIQTAIRPLVWLMNALANLVTRPLGLGRVDAPDEQRVTVDELRLITTDAAAQGVLSARERSLILNALAIGRRTARQIMVPRMRVRYLDLQWSMDENRAVMNEYLHSRLPLCNGGMDKVVGIVLTKEFLSAYHAQGDTKVLALIARPPVFVPEWTALDKLLEVYRDNSTQMVFLVDEYGGVEGIVTLRDVVDELIGQLDLSAAAPAGDRKSLVVPGDTPVHELAQRLDRADWASDASAATVGGLIIARLNRFPLPGEQVEIDGVRLRVLQSDSRTVRQVQATPVTPAAASES